MPATVHAVRNIRDPVTVLGLGSLMSARSSLTTFSTLENFRLGFVPGYVRQFVNPFKNFFIYGIADVASGEFGSLSGCAAADAPANAACHAGTPDVAGIFVVAFEVEKSEFDAMQEREFGYTIKTVPYLDVPEEAAAQFSGLDATGCQRAVVGGAAETGLRRGEGLLCLPSCDEDMLADPAQKSIMDEIARKFGLHHMWRGWRARQVWIGSPEVGAPGSQPPIWPCRGYLRHCLLAADNLGTHAEHPLFGLQSARVIHDCFLRHTYLVDGSTLESWLERPGKYGEVMNSKAPETAAGRYDG